jgi:hypothetical protein
MKRLLWKCMWRVWIASAPTVAQAYAREGAGVMIGAIPNRKQENKA